jgi:hypothetical protein
MEHNEIVFEALPPEKFFKKRKAKLFISGFLLVFALAYLITGILYDDGLKWIGGIVFMLTYGIWFWDNYHLKPVQVKISSFGIWMQQPGSELNVAWNEVKNSVYNGRYLDLFVQSSIRETLDLKPFSQQVQSQILNQVDDYLSGQGLTIKYMGVSKETVAASL